MVQITGSQKMNPTDFGDPHLAPPAGQSFHLSSKISQHLLDGIVITPGTGTNIHGSYTMYPTDFGDPLTFPLAPP